MSDELTQEPPVAEPTAQPEPTAPSAPVAAALTPLAQRFLSQTRPWVRFMAIVAFATAALMMLFGGFMLVLSFFGGLAARSQGELGPLGGALRLGFMSVTYVVLAALYVPAGVFLFRYASAIRRIEFHATDAGLEEALRYQKSFWRYAGILTVIGLVVTILMLAVAVLVAGVAAAMAAAGRS